MAAGVPCVSTDVGDAARIIGDTGVVVPIKSPHALAKSIAQLADEPEQLFQKRKAAARRKIVDEYSQEAIVENYQGFHQKMIDSSPTRFGVYE